MQNMRSTSTFARVQGADGSSWHRRRRGYWRLGTQLKHGTDRGERGDLGCVLTSGRYGQRWPNLSRRQWTVAGVLQLGLLPRDTPRAPGEGETGLGMHIDVTRLRETATSSGGRPCLQTGRWPAAPGSVVEHTRRQCRGKEGNMD
jgi:hypothetical protein